MNFDSFSEGDAIRFEYDFCTIPMDATRSGTVKKSLTVPGVGDVLFVEVEHPTRTVEYELRAAPDDEEEQVVKHLKGDGDKVGTFGPLLSVISP